MPLRMKTMEQPVYLKALFECFPDAYLTKRNDFIIEDVGNVYINLDGINCYEGAVLAVLYWCSRAICKSMPYRTYKLNTRYRAKLRDKFNRLLNKDLSEHDWEIIYCHLGNAVNPDLAVHFYDSGFDMKVLKDACIRRGCTNC